MAHPRFIAIVVAGHLGLVATGAKAQTQSDAEPDHSTPEGKKVNEKGEPVDKLTPVKPPLPPSHDEPAYQLYWEVDAPLLVVATVFGIGRSLRSGLAPAYCAPAPGSAVEASTHCDPQNLNWLDRKVAGRYSPGWGRWSNVGLYGIEALGAAGILVDEGIRAGLNDLVVVAEATLLSSAAAGASTAMTGRPRPYLYGTAAPTSVRESGDGGLSYFSGHTSTSFGAATSLFVTLHRRHPDDRWPWLVLAGGLTAASFVGATRVLAGSHFPTDVIAGAAVGAGIGLLVPALHAAPRRLTPVPMAVTSGGGIALVGDLP